MVKVTNTGTNPVVLSDGTLLPLGEGVEVKNWSKLKAHHLTAAMIEAGLISAGAESPEDSADERADLFAKLKALGVDATGNSKTETLRKKLEEAEAAKSAADAEAALKLEVIAELKGLNVEVDEAASLADLQAALATAKA